MAKRRVIVEMSYNEDLAKVAFSDAPTAGKELDTDTVPKIAGVNFDKSFAPVNLPGLAVRTAMDVPYVSGAKFDLASSPEQSTYIVRAEVDEGKIHELSSNKSVVGVYADVEIRPTIICPGSAPMGTDKDVENLLCVPQMHEHNGMDGSGVMIAIVDTGFNLDYLAAHGKQITLDAARSWVPSDGMEPGNAPVNHGTMCAFDAAIAAPKATFLDVQLLLSSAYGPTEMSGLLSDGVRAYNHLWNIMTAPRRPGECRSMVVSNSWGMFHPSWDFPAGDPGNYSDNMNHPFNKMVSALEQAGADILFAAGNCGKDCPDGRCKGVTTNAIYGANSHPSVLTIAGVDVTKSRVGYSTQGPGRLSLNKPDLCGYTHFKGSGVYAADGGTSAATPVVAGVVAAVRTKAPYSPGNPANSPSAMRAFMRSTAEDLGGAGFDFDTGFGVVGGCAIYRKFFKPIIPPINICKLYPWLPFCNHWPPKTPASSTSANVVQESMGLTADMEIGTDIRGLDEANLGRLLEAIWQAGYNGGLQAASGEGAKRTSSCGCCNTK